MIRFGSMSGFVAHLATLPAAIDTAEHAGLEAAAVLLQKEARDDIGVYQGAAGALPAWAALAPATQADRVRKGFTPDDPGLRTGAMRDSIERDVGEHHASVGSNDPRLVHFEFGTATQPARPVLGGVAFRHGEAAAHRVGAAVAAAFAGLPAPDTTIDKEFTP